MKPYEPNGRLKTLTKIYMRNKLNEGWPKEVPPKNGKSQDIDINKGMNVAVEQARSLIKGKMKEISLYEC